MHKFIIALFRYLVVFHKERYKKGMDLIAEK